MVEQSALGDAGGAGGGIHRRRPLALVDQDRLERVEHALSGVRGTTHGLDRIECRSTSRSVTSVTIPAGRFIYHDYYFTQDIAIADARAPRVGWRGWAALVVLMLPVLLVSVDNTVLSFALPQIALDLEPTATQQLWIIDAYPLVLASLLVTMGVLGDRFGRRRMLLIGATGFGVVSALAAFAPSAEWLIAARAAMGVFGAMLMPSTLSLLRSIFTNRDQRRLAIAVWAAGFSAGAALGPVVGGILLEHFAWGAVFLMAVPVLVPLLILVPILVPESRDPNPGRFDPLSVALSLLTMVPIVYAIKEFAVHGAESPLPAGPGRCGRRVRRAVRAPPEPPRDADARHGAVPPSDVLGLGAGEPAERDRARGLPVLRRAAPAADRRPFAAGGGTRPRTRTARDDRRRHRRRSDRQAGCAARRRADRPELLDPRLPAGRRQREHRRALPLLIAAFVALGVGIGAAETVSNELILASAPPAKAGAASAVSETAYELGAVLGTTIIGGLLAAFYRANLALPAGLPAEVADAARETLAGAVAGSDALDEVLGQALRDAAAHAFDAGVGVTALIGAGLIVVAAVIAALTLGGRQKRVPVDH